jgi:DNA polymerase III gamma/tau subunit
MPSTIARMNYKAQNLRTIEAIVNTLPPTNANRTPLLNYIRNLKITLTCLLDSIHDFSCGPIMQGANGYIDYIITELDNQASALPNHITKLYIREWLQGWDSLATKNTGTQNLRNNHNGSINTFLQKARGNSVENFVAFLLNVDPVVVNKYNNQTPTPHPAAAVAHQNAFAAVHDYADRETVCPLLFDSLYENAREKLNQWNSIKFFTVRDNGFISYIFYDRDSNGPISLTDTIYSSPGLWDNGGWSQKIRNSAAQTQHALAIPLNLETRNVILHQDLNNPNMINSTDRADGGILGFRFIRTEYNPPFPDVVPGDNPDAQNAWRTGGVTFGNIIYTPSVYIIYDTRITFPDLDAMDKRQVKSLVTTLIAGSNTLSLGTWLKEVQPFFECPAGAPHGFGSKVTGWNAIKYALSQSAPYKKKNAMMVIGCLLDLKRSGDFMQSASVSKHQDAYNMVTVTNPATTTNPKRIGIFATNDRIAGYISAKIHENYTMLSMPGKPYSTLVVWNGISKTNAAGTGRAATDATRINSVAKNTLQVGGGNKKQKRNKKKKGGVFTFDNAYWSQEKQADDFAIILKRFNHMHIYIESRKYGKITIDECAEILNKLYKHIDKSRELIINFFRSYCAAKIERIDYGTPQEVNKIKAQFPVFNGEEEMDVEDDDKMGFEELKHESNTDDTVFINAIANKVFEKLNNFLNYLDIAFHHANLEQITILVRMYKPFADILEKIYMYQAKGLEQLIHKFENKLPLERGSSPSQVINDLATFIDLVSFKQSNDIEEKRAEALREAEQTALLAWEKKVQPGIVLDDSSREEVIATKHALDMEVIRTEAHAIETAHARNNPFNTFEQFIGKVKSAVATEQTNRVDFLLNMWNEWVKKVGAEDALIIYETLNEEIVYYHDECLYLQGMPSNAEGRQAEASIKLALRFYLLFQYDDGTNDFLKQIAHVTIKDMENTPNWWMPGAVVPNLPHNPFDRTNSMMSQANTPQASRMGSPENIPLTRRGGYGNKYTHHGDRFGGSGGSTKVVVYSDKIKKLTELNKKLRKNKIKNKNKIEKNNKQINELKDKIKKEKQKEKEKIKKEKQKEKEKIKKEKEKEKEKIKKGKQKEKEKIKKQTKQQIKKETKQKEKVKKETKQKQQVNKQKDEKTKKSNTKK